MSAYVVEKKTIDRAVAAISGVLNGMHVHAGRTYWPILAKHVHRGCQNLLGATLWRMNARAVSQRYDEEPQEDGNDYRWGDGICRPAQALKTLDCLLYQCSEGTVPNTKLYREVTALRDYLRHEFISSQPDYEQAEWA